ncbi:MAG: AMP-binding protein, partial [Gammaproteobacteria bacterium]|nr:AMP-binding protein [Gammaproteobacteria bacterium]
LQHQLEAWQDKVKHFVIAYGPTETAIACTGMEFDGSTEHASSNIIGLPFPNVTYYVLDAHMQPVPVGVIGELYIGGYVVGRGYLNRPDLTRKAFIKNPFSSDEGSHIYKTGDIVKLLPDGSIFFIGRNDGQVKIRGQRVELGDVEMALQSMNPSITRAVVLVHEEILVGFVTPGSVDASAVKTSVVKVLPPYMVPSVVLSVDFIPTALSGKVDRHALLSLLVESKATHRSGGTRSPPGQHIVPNSPLEEAVLAIYRKVLQNERMGMASNFIENGGDSLKAVRIVAYLRTLHEEHPELQTGKRFSTLSVTDILQQHTPGALLQSCLGCSSAMHSLATGMSIIPRPTEMRLQAPASFQQTTMYTGEHLTASQARSDYNESIRFGAIGNLDINALKMALAFLWRQQQVLRTALTLQVPQFSWLVFYVCN